MIVEVPYRELSGLMTAKASLEKIVNALDMFGAPVDEFDKDILRVEVFPNRVDLLSPEGIARALDGFLGAKTGYPVFGIVPSKVDLTVKKTKTRPFVSFSSVVNTSLDGTALTTLMQFQEKLHDTFGRDRRKYSIGVYDLDKIGTRIMFKEIPLTEIHFTPLGEKSEMNGKEILESTEKGRRYSHLLKDSAPVLIDEEGRIMSMAPIVNADYCKVTADTKNIFIDSTGTDEGTDSMVAVVATSLVQRGGSIGAVLPGPSFLPKRVKIDLNYINRISGLNLDRNELAILLSKMRFGFDGDVLVPPYRTDVFGQIDIAEDVVIAHGYEKFSGILPPSYSPGEPLAVRNFENEARKILSGLGFIELKTFMLSSPGLTGLCGGHSLEVNNPRSVDYSALRSSLIPGLFDVLAINTDADYPQKVFEVGHVFSPDEGVKISGLIAHGSSSFSEVKSLVDHILSVFSSRPEWREGAHPFFMEGRTAVSDFGVYGEAKPEISSKIGVPLAGFELNLERIL